MSKFVLFVGTDRQYHWNLKAANGEIVCWSEAYVSKQSAINSIAWVRNYAPSADIDDRA